MKQSKMRPEALADFFEELGAQSEMGDEKWAKRLELLSTHPMGSTRRDYIQETIANDPGFDYEPKVRVELDQIWQELRTRDSGINTVDEVIDEIWEEMKGEEVEEPDLLDESRGVEGESEESKLLREAYEKEMERTAKALDSLQKLEND